MARAHAITTNAAPALPDPDRTPLLPPVFPTWTYTAPRGIEWFRVLRPASDDGKARSARAPSAPAPHIEPTVVLADASGAVSLLDLGSGRSLWPSAVRRRPGTRLADPPLTSGAAPRNSDAAPPVSNPGVCVFDRESTSVIDLQTGALRWSVGGPSYAPAWERDEDPEFLTRIVAAAAVDGAVFVVRDDGAAALLDDADGRPRWTLRVPARADYSVLVREGGAALVSGIGGETLIVWVSWSPTGPKARLAAPFPWTTSWNCQLADGALVLVGAEHVSRVSQDGAVFSLGVPEGVVIATVHLVASASGECIALADRSGGVRLIDPVGGRCVWGPVSLVPTIDGTKETHDTAMHIAGPWIVAGARGRYGVINALDGETRIAARRGPRILTAVESGDQLFVVSQPVHTLPDRLRLDCVAPGSPTTGRRRSVALGELRTELPAAPVEVAMIGDLFLAHSRATLSCLRLRSRE